ncbi:MAG: hypothetical protein WCR98_06965 [Saccharofermentanales bacterium]|nr:hypothetical protein [Kiritimatiellia bacterium]MDD3546034.1 hypothetical protein [Kiritimatiellia bacterium]MDD4623016.1 hypothetical protein [Kiritimatiellia bacterium]
MHRFLALIFTGRDYVVGLVLFCLPFVLFTSLVICALILKKKGRKIAALISATIGLLMLFFGIGMIAATMHLI